MVCREDGGLVDDRYVGLIDVVVFVVGVGRLVKLIVEVCDEECV